MQPTLKDNAQMAFEDTHKKCSPSFPAAKAMNFIKTGIALTLVAVLMACNSIDEGIERFYHESFYIAIDTAGNLYVAKAKYGSISKKTPNEESSNLTDEKFDWLRGITVDAVGNVFAADHHSIRKVTPNGKVSTLAGSRSGFADGHGQNARFNKPHGIAVDAAGNLYVADTKNHRIRKVTPNGEVSTLAGNEQGFADGWGRNARFNEPNGIAIDAAGNLYIGDEGNHRIRKVTPNGEVSTLAGSEQGFADGQGSAARFHNPSGIAIDAVGNLYVADTRNKRIRKVSLEGEVSTLADDQGSSNQESIRQLHSPRSVAIDAAGDLYVSGFGGGFSKIRQP